MQPQTAQQPGSAGEQYKPKWRHFHPLDRVWLQNPFDDDIIFQVADEYNRPFKYRLRAHETSELPGGAIATLGVKAVVDQLIQNNKTDAPRLWDGNIRKKYEADVILRVIETKAVPTEGGIPGVIDLGVKSPVAGAETPAEPPKAEEAFPGLNQPAAEPASPGLAPLPAGAQEGLADVVAASLPAEDIEIPANADHGTE